MSERLLVIEPRTDLLEEAIDAELLSRPLYLVVVRLGEYAIDLAENSKGDLEAIEEINIDFEKLEITQGKFMVGEKINKSRTITVAEDGTMSKIAPEHKVEGVCSVGANYFPNPAVLHIPDTKNYAAYIEIFRRDTTEYLHPSNTAV